MARFASDGMVKVYYVASIANKAAPTVAELAAGTDLSNFVRKGGLNVPNSQNMVDNASLAETFDAQVPGSYGGPISLEMFRDPAADTAWNLLTYGLAGYIVVRRGVAAATAWTAAQKVEVYPVSFHEPVMAQTASNEAAFFTAQGAGTSAPNAKATVA
jgi:hypothetical protein